MPSVTKAHSPSRPTPGRSLSALISVTDKVLLPHLCLFAGVVRLRHADQAGLHHVVPAVDTDCFSTEA